MERDRESERGEKKKKKEGGSPPRKRRQLNGSAPGMGGEQSSQGLGRLQPGLWTDVVVLCARMYIEMRT